MILFLAGVALVVLMFYFTRQLQGSLPPERFRQMMRLLIPIYLLINGAFTLFMRIPGEYPVVLVPLRSYFATFGWDVKSFADLGQLFGGSWEETAAFSLEFLLDAGQNIVLFMPFGFLLCAVSGHPRTARILLLGLLLSLFIEGCQLLLRIGCFDTGDTLHNILGTYLGVRLYRRVPGKTPTQKADATLKQGD